MACFFCDREGIQQPAIGLCLHCGRAVCRRHLRLRRIPGALPGLSAAKPPLTELICPLCAAELGCLAADLCQAPPASPHESCDAATPPLTALDVTSILAEAETLLQRQSHLQQWSVLVWLQALRARLAQLLQPE
jgi:hypothetical protein